MLRFQKICVGWNAFDGAPGFVDQIRDLTTRHDAHVELVHVVPEHTYYVWLSDDDTLKKLVCTERLERLEEVADQIRKDGLTVHCHVLAGDPHIELIRHVHRTRCDLLYIVDEPRHRDDERSFGPTTQHLLRECPTPVWAARLGATGRPQRIVAAVDLMPTSEEAERPNERILDACLRIAEPSSEVVLLHVWNVWGEQLLRPRMPKAEFTRVMEHALGKHRTALNAWASRFEAAGISAIPRLEHGEGRAVLPRLIERIDPELVVMGTLCRTGLLGLIVGNTAERIINRLSCSILTVKPESFVSPVLLEDTDHSPPPRSNCSAA